MKASEIIRETKRIDPVLAGRLEWALRYAAPMVDFNYQHYTNQNDRRAKVNSTLQMAD